MYSRVVDISRHTESINCVEFSVDGAYLASADDAGLLVITDVVKGEMNTYFEFDDSITALLWVPESGNLFVGLANCELHFVSLADDKTYNADLRPEGYSHLQPKWKDLLQINCLSFHAQRSILAISVGYSVVVLTIGEMDTYRQASAITPFQTLIALPGEVRSVQFVEGGDAVVITYLEEGARCYDLESGTERWRLDSKSPRIGRSAIDSLEKYMVCSNLSNGFDLYDLRRLKHIREIPHTPIEEALNVPLPALFMGSDLMLLGTACGAVMVASSAAVPGSPLVLDHGDDIIQALAFVEVSKSLSYLAMGAAEKGSQTYVRIWRKDQDPAVPGERVMVSQGVGTSTNEALDAEGPLVDRIATPKSNEAHPDDDSHIDRDLTSTKARPIAPTAEAATPRRRVRLRSSKGQRTEERAAGQVDAESPSCFPLFFRAVSSIVALLFVLVILINLLDSWRGDDTEDGGYTGGAVDYVEASRIASSRLAEQLDRRFLHRRTSSMAPTSGPTRGADGHTPDIAPISSSATATLGSAALPNVSGTIAEAALPQIKHTLVFSTRLVEDGENE